MINRDSELAGRFWENSRVPDCPILDFHAHMGPFYGGYLPVDTAEAMVGAMDDAGVALTCFVSHNALYAPATGRSEDLSVALRFPDRLKAYHIVCSHALRPEEDLQRIRENRAAYVGFKFHPSTYKVPLSAAQHRPYWAFANENRLLVLSHTWGGSQYDGPEEAEKILREYPDLVLLAGHSFHGSWSEAVKLAERYPNLYLELTAVLDDRGALDFLVSHLGSERILFGVDQPWFAYHHGIGAVLSARLTDEDRRNIFYRNGMKVLARFPWFADIRQKNAGSLS